MRSLAAGILLLIVASVLLQPLVEQVNITREKIVLRAALANAGRAAKHESVMDIHLRNRDAVVDEGRFRQSFAEAFEKALNLSLKNNAGNGNALTFSSNDGRYNDINVTLQFETEEDDRTGQTISRVRMKAETDFPFRTRYMQLAANARGTRYTLTGESLLVIGVLN